MQKSNLAKGIGALLKGSGPNPDTGKAKNMMNMLSDDVIPPASEENNLPVPVSFNDDDRDIKEITGDDKVQPILTYQLLSNETIKECGFVKGRPTYNIPTDMIIEREGFNVRDDMGDLEALGNSLWTEGQLQPLKIDLLKIDGKIVGVLIDGHRRIYAAMLLLKTQGKRIETFECFITGVETTEVDRIKMLHISQDNKKLEPLEHAKIALRLSETKMSKEAIGKLAGKSEGWAADMILLAKEPDDIKQLIREKKVLHTTVIELIRTEPDIEKRKEIILESLEKTGSFTTTDVRVRKAQKQKKTTEVEPQIEEKAKDILGPEMWKFGNLIQEIKKGDLGPKEIRKKLSILQEQPGNPIAIFYRLERFKEHLSLFYSQDLQAKSKIIIDYLYGEIDEENLLKIVEGLQVEESLQNNELE